MLPHDSVVEKALHADPVKRAADEERAKNDTYDALVSAFDTGLRQRRAAYECTLLINQCPVCAAARDWAVVRGG